MASFRDILAYFRHYRSVAIYSISAASLFESIDLVVPYAIGQILNVLSRQPIDLPLQHLTNRISQMTAIPSDRSLELGILLSLYLPP
jgi:ATP-binding cassette subfamily B protein